MILRLSFLKIHMVVKVNAFTIFPLDFILIHDMIYEKNRMYNYS